MKGIKKQHRSEMSPQINPQGPLSDLPRLHVVDESNMEAEMAVSNGRVGDLSLSWKRQVKSVGIFWFLSTEGRAQNKGKLGYDEGNL